MIEQCLVAIVDCLGIIAESTSGLRKDHCNTLANLVICPPITLVELLKLERESRIMPSLTNFGRSIASMTIWRRANPVRHGIVWIVRVSKSIFTMRPEVIFRLPQAAGKWGSGHCFRIQFYKRLTHPPEEL